MKKTLILLTASALLVAACEEKPIEIPEITLGKRKVIVEELTGVQCPNCPDGTSQLIGLDALFGDTSVIIVSIHAAQGFSEPFPASQHDFRTTDGDNLANFIGSPLGYPSAAVNRVRVNNRDYLLKQQWPGAITTQLDTSYQIRLTLDNSYNPTTRALNMAVNIAPRLSIAGDYRLSVFITEDSIVDPQQVNLTYVPNYVHRHVLRDIVTAFNGDAIGALTANNAVSRDFNLVLPAGWNAEHCSVVAFVHRGGDPDKEVMQAVEEHVTD